MIHQVKNHGKTLLFEHSLAMRSLHQQEFKLILHYGGLMSNLVHILIGAGKSWTCDHKNSFQQISIL